MVKRLPCRRVQERRLRELLGVLLDEFGLGCFDVSLGFDGVWENDVEVARVDVSHSKYYAARIVLHKDRVGELYADGKKARRVLTHELIHVLLSPYREFLQDMKDSLVIASLMSEEGKVSKLFEHQLQRRISSVEERVVTKLERIVSKC